MKIIWIFIITTIVLLIIASLLYFEKNIEFQEVKVINKTYEANGDDIHIISTPDDKILKRFEIDISEIDMKQNKLILTEGRRLIKIAYKNNLITGSPIMTGGTLRGIVEVKLEEKFTENTLYMYKIDKLSIYLDELIPHRGITYE